MTGIELAHWSAANRRANARYTASLTKLNQELIKLDKENFDNFRIELLKYDDKGQLKELIKDLDSG